MRTIASRSAFARGCMSADEAAGLHLFADDGYLKCAGSTSTHGSEAQCILNGSLPINGNVAKRSASFYEVYGKVNITLNDQFAVGFNEYYSPNFLNLGAWGNYASVTAKWTAPSTTFGSSGIGMYISGEFGRQWLGTSDAFYGVVSPLGQLPGRYPGAELQHLEHRRRLHLQGVHAGRPLLRHQPVEGSCNAFTCDFSTTNFNVANITAINPGGFGSNWCGATGIVKLSADLTATTNLK